MKNQFRFSVLCLSVSLLSTIATAQSETNLSAIVGEDTFNAAGLDKLSPEEQAVLATWITNRETEAEAQVEERIAQVVEERVEEERQRAIEERKKKAKLDFGLDRRDEFAVDSITTTVRGHFEGWTGKTRFYLENGQVWQQRLGGTYYKYIKNPEVSIAKESLGYWMTVKKTGARVAVMRLE
ncbi:MAG: hypothetical protein AB3N64_10895 [Puniceicoccaceae bacterium]